MHRHARRSCRLRASLKRTLRADVQQLNDANKYNATVTQPPMVGSPMPGDQLKCIMMLAVSVTNLTDRIEHVGSGPAALDGVGEGSDGGGDLRTKHDGELGGSPACQCPKPA